MIMTTMRTKRRISANAASLRHHARRYRHRRFSLANCRKSDAQTTWERKWKSERMQRCVPVGRRCPSSSSAIIEKNEREKKNNNRRRFRRSSTVVRNNNDNINAGRRRNQINLKANERANERRKQAVIELSKERKRAKGTAIYAARRTLWKERGRRKS